MINDGFFTGKKKKINFDKDNKKSEQNEIIDDEDRYDIYNMKYNQLMDKYNENKELFKKKNIKLNQNYDYVKKCRGTMVDIYGISNSVDNLDINNNYKKAFNDNYNNNFKNKSLSKTKNSNSNRNKHLSKDNKTEYLKNIKYISDNLNNQNDNNNTANSNDKFDYEDLINEINKEQIIQYYKINKRNKNKLISSRSNNDHTIFSYMDKKPKKRYIFAPLVGIPVTNISFRARLKYFSNKKEKDIKNMMKSKIEEENQIYTFEPKTHKNRLNIIKYDKNIIKNDLNNSNNLKEYYNDNKKRKVDIKRIHDLYLDYKDKKNKREELSKEYYEKAGISFVPRIIDKNKEIIQFKKKIGQILFLDRVDIYNHNKELNRMKNNNQ